MKRALWLLALLPASALADIPPPPGWVSKCTVEKQCRADEEGTTCAANHAERDKCEKSLAGDGWVRRCKTRGASVWTEVYCRRKADGDKQPPAPGEAVPAPGSRRPAELPKR